VLRLLPYVGLFGSCKYCKPENHLSKEVRERGGMSLARLSYSEGDTAHARRGLFALLF